MPIPDRGAETGSVVDRLRAVGWGASDSRVRASWRVLLAVPLLWTLTGSVLAGNVQSAIGVVPDGGATGGGVAQSLLHAGFFLVALVAWARALDRRPLSAYGVSPSRGWARDLLVGFAAVLVGSGVWTGLASVLGGTTVEVAPSLPRESVLVGLVLPFVALVLHAAVQQVVFFRVVLAAAAEGLYSRGGSAAQAAVGALPVAVLLFVLMHGSATALRIFDLAVAGSVFGLLYLHTGELALGIGAHFGALYSGIAVSAVVRVSGSPSGALGVLDRYGFPTMVIAYALLAAVLWWRGEPLVRRGIARSPGD